MDLARRAVAQLMDACDTAGLESPAQRALAMESALVRSGIAARACERFSRTLYWSEESGNVPHFSTMWGSGPLVEIGDLVLSPERGLESWQEVLSRAHAEARPGETDLFWCSRWARPSVGRDQDLPDEYNRAVNRTLGGANEHEGTPALGNLDVGLLRTLEVACRPTGGAALVRQMEDLAWRIAGEQAYPYQGVAASALLEAATILNVEEHIPVRVEHHGVFERVGDQQWAGRTLHVFLSDELPGYGLEVALLRSEFAVTLLGHREGWEPGKKVEDYRRRMPFQRVREGKSEAAQESMGQLVALLKEHYLGMGGAALARRAPPRM